jgi:hypothetical protein
LLFPSVMKIEVRTEAPTDPKSHPEGAFQAVEVLEGVDEFLEALQMRLNEIVLKPSGRFVISYIPGKPGSKVPPRVQ